MASALLVKTNDASANLSTLLKASASIVEILAHSSPDELQQEALGNFKTQYDTLYKQLVEDVEWIEKNESSEGSMARVETESKEESLQELRARRDELRQISKKNVATIKQLLDKSRALQLQLASVTAVMQDRKR